MSTLYKIYLRVLAERIKKKCEDKRVIPQNQRVQGGDGHCGQHICTKLCDK